MTCLFIYTEHQSELCPIDIIFRHKIHQYGQCYIITTTDIQTPKYILIDNLFYGKVINCEKYNNIFIIYCVNETVRNVFENQVIYWDTLKNIAKTNFNTYDDLLFFYYYCKMTKIIPEIINIVYDDLYNINSDSILPDLVVNGQQVINQHVINISNINACGYKNIRVNHFSLDYMTFMLYNILINKLYIFKSLLNIKIHVGDFILHNKEKLRIIYLKHMFKNNLTIIKCIVDLKILIVQNSHVKRNNINIYNYTVNIEPK